MKSDVGCAEAIAAGHTLESFQKPGFSFICKLVVNNEFWEAALLQGGSFTAGPSTYPPVDIAFPNLSWCS